MLGCELSSSVNMLAAVRFKIEDTRLDSKPLSHTLNEIITLLYVLTFTLPDLSY